MRRAAARPRGRRPRRRRRPPRRRRADASCAAIAAAAARPRARTCGRRRRTARAPGSCRRSRRSRSARAAGRCVEHAADRQVGQRIGADELADLLDIDMRRGDELGLDLRVDAVEAGMEDGRRADAQVDLARPRRGAAAPRSGAWSCRARWSRRRPPGGLPRTCSRSALSFMFTPRWRIDWMAG